MLAYLILAHTSPRQVSCLVDALQGSDVAFFIHVDRKADIGHFRYMLRHHRNVYFVRPRLVIEWAGWNMVQAELSLIRRALRKGAQYMVLLSGMDYPVWSNRRLKDFYLSSKKNYIEHYRIPSPYWDRGARNRIHQYWVCDDPIPFKSELWFRTVGRIWRPVWHRIIRRYTNLIFKLGFELGLKRIRQPALVHYLGSQWWAMTRDCAEYVINFVQKNPDVTRFYRHSHVPDESFIQTIVMNSPLRDTVVNSSLRYVEWDGAFNPRILDRSDMDSILKSRSSFVRKVVLSPVKERSGRVVSSADLVQALEKLRNRHEDEYADSRKPSGETSSEKPIVPSVSNDGDELIETSVVPEVTTQHVVS